MSQLEEAFQRSLLALDELQQHIEQQQVIWQKNYQQCCQKLEQAQLKEAKLLAENQRLNHQIAELNFSPENQMLVRQFKTIAAHLQALEQDVNKFRHQLSAASSKSN